jgi:hypothetical protein
MDLRAIAKWSAWNSLYGIPKYEAQEYYIDDVIHVRFCVIEKALTEQVLAQAKSDESERALAEIGCKFKLDH